MEIHTRILQMLNHITPLVQEKNNSPQETASRIHLQIHQQFARIEWLLKMEGLQMQVNPEAYADAQLLSVSRTLVAEQRVEFNCTKEDLRNLAILPKPEVVVVEPVAPSFHVYFENYDDLPALVRSSILSFVTEPEDKLNFLAALPWEAELMHCTEIALNFELDFRNMLANNQLRWSNQVAIRLLRNLSPEFRNVVNRYFEQHLWWDLKELKQPDFGFLGHLPGDLQADDVPRDHRTESHLYPFTVPVLVLLEQNMSPGLLQTLRTIGGRVWNLQICIDLGLPVTTIVERLQQVLELTPNVRKLMITNEPSEELMIQVMRNANQDQVLVDMNQMVGNLNQMMGNANQAFLGMDQALETAWDKISVMTLPRLGYLKNIRFGFILGIRQETSQALVKRKLLESYGSRLNQLSIESHVTVQDIRYRLASPCTHLKGLFIANNSRNQGPDYVHEVINRFAGSPLQVLLGIDVNAAATEPQGFAELMYALSTNFGATLRELSMNVANFQNQEPPENREFPVLFPVLSKLKLHSVRNRQQNDRHSEILAWFQHSPLQTVKLTGFWNHLFEVFVPTMQCLCQHFRYTLEELTLDLDFPLDMPDGQFVQPTRLVDLIFPNMKRLTLSVDLLDGWELLLCFPTLEKITLSPLVVLGGEVEVERVLEFSSNVNTLRGANVWKLLPHLEEVAVERIPFGLGNMVRLVHERTFDRVTRAECIAAQREN